MQHGIRTRSVFIAFAILGLAIVALSQSSGTAQWQIAGHDLSNSRSQPDEHVIGTANVAQLAVKWTFTTGGDVSATPIVAGANVYFPDWAGNLFAVSAKDGKQLWSHKISDYDNVPGAISRVSPAMHGSNLILGDIQNSQQAHNGASIMSVDRNTGALTGSPRSIRIRRRSSPALRWLRVKWSTWVFRLTRNCSRPTRITRVAASA